MKVQENISLKRFNTFGIDAYSKYFLEVNSISAIQQFLDDKKLNLLPRLVLGGGSNVLFTGNFDGVVLKNGIKGIELLKEDEAHYYVKAGGGDVWHEFVLHCIGKDYAGIENLSLIPGSVGAAPIQNIGAYGAEQKEVFFELEAIDLLENKLIVFSNAACRFGYRDSIFKRGAKGKYMITSVTYRLLKTPAFNTSYGAIGQELEKLGVKQLSISAISQAVCNIRRSKLPDPAVLGNAGSFFKNPSVSSAEYKALKKKFPGIVGYPAGDEVKLAAGWMIEQCGWKGRSFGHYGVHKDQALVMVNYGGAKGKEIYELSGKILESVKNRFGVVLEREVVII